MDFQAICKEFEEKRKEIVHDESGINYSFYVLINELDTNEIDFSRFTWHNIDYAEESISWAHEDSGDGETFTLLPDHEYTKMLNIIQILFEVERAPKHFGPSPFNFL